MLNPLIYALRMRHIRASVAALLSFLCFRHFGRTFAINQISMNFITNTQFQDSEPNSRRCSRYLPRMSSDIEPPLPASTQKRCGSISKAPKRSASVAAVSTRNGPPLQGQRNSRNSCKPMRTCTEADEFTILTNNNKQSSCI